MYTLFLDIAGAEPLIAVVDTDKVIASMVIADAKSDAQLMPVIESLLKKAKLKLTQLERIACVHGPGGFMTLRVAVSLANALAWSLKIPACGIHRSDVIAARAGKTPFVWLHSTRREALFVRGFGIDGFPTEPTLMPLDELKKLSSKISAWAGECIPEHLLLISESKKLELKKIEEILPVFLDNQTYESKILLPWYGRGA